MPARIRQHVIFVLMGAVLLILALPISTFARTSTRVGSRAISITKVNSDTEAGYYIDLRKASVLANNVEGSFTVSALNSGSTLATLYTFLGIGSTGSASATNGGVAFVGVNQQTDLAYYFITSEHKYHYLFSVDDGDTVLARVYFDASTGLWGLYIEDSHTGHLFQQEFSIAPDNRFVDFLLQHPSTNYPLPDFKTINFGPTHWTDSNGNHQPIDSSEVGVQTVQETMHDPSGGSGCPSDIRDDSNGESYFSVAKC